MVCVLSSLNLGLAPETPGSRCCAGWMAGNVLLEKAFLASHCLNNNEVSIHVCAARFSDSAAIVLCNDLHYCLREATTSNWQKSKWSIVHKDVDY